MSDEDGLIFKEQYVQLIIPHLHRLRGQHQVLIDDLKKLSIEALEDLYHILRDHEDEIRRLERTFRPFPGGPQIHM